MPNKETKALNRALCEFLDSSPSPFHATKSMAGLLENAGFSRLDEAEGWTLQPQGKYFVTRNESSIIAWVQGSASLVEQGIRMVGAHTDSPCLKAKPVADIHRHDCWQIGVEVYGGALLNPWFDRDLSLAGRVHYRDSDASIKSALVDFRDPIAVVPSLAIHLDREANKKRSVNAQHHLPVLLSVGDGKKPALDKLLLSQLQQDDSNAEAILDYELCFYDTQGAAQIGVNGDFIASARLDNLLSCFVGLQALLNAGDEQCSLLVCNDHEEVGSGSAAGAAGPFLQQVLSRLLPDKEDYARAISRSLLVSADNAHGLHPNFADKMDDNHGPRLNAGPVIKVNANQRYASNSETQSIFRSLCQHAGSPVQTFVVRSDMGCGSTIGPITAAEIGIKTIDVGVPTYAMHSIRELAGSKDPLYLKKVLDELYKRSA